MGQIRTPMLVGTTMAYLQFSRNCIAYSFRIYLKRGALFVLLLQWFYRG